jgi:hypothetical protein
MDIKIPKVLASVDFGEYAPELKGKKLHVWVNPPLALLRKHDEALALIKPKNLLPLPTDAAAPEFATEEAKEEAKGAFREFYAELWSQHADNETYWSADELAALEEADPAFFSWMVAQTWTLRNEHISKKKRS